MALEDVEEYRSSGLDNHEWCLVQNSDTSIDIYGELQNTADKFKKLADRLQKTASRKDLTTEQAVQTNGCCEETRTKLMQCVAENLRLRQSLKDVSDINHRWQDYNYDRQKHAQHLASTVSELRSTIEAMRQQSTKSSPLPLRESESNDQSSIATNRTTDAKKQQSRKFSSSMLQKKSEGNESDVPNQMQSPSELGQTVGTMKHECRKSAVQQGSETNLSNNETELLNDKLSHEVRVLSRQLRDARNETSALKQQLEKATEENDSLRTQLTMYKSEWKDENREKVEALGQAQRVVQELCALKVNCQMQAERLMKMCTVTFNCSLCNGQNRQTLNNLDIDSQLEHNAKGENKERHKKLTKAAAAIIQSVDGIEVHLQERSPGDTLGKRKVNCSSPKMTSEKKLSDSTNPIVTFPDSDSDEQTITSEKSCVQSVTTSQHLVCPVCSTSFLRENGSQFLDHYTKCKLSPGKHTS